MKIASTKPANKPLSVLKKPVSAASSADYQKLRIWNSWFATVYAVQAILILVLGTTKTLPATVSYLTTNTLASDVAHVPMLATAVRHVFDVNLAFLVVAFLAAAAAAHGVAAAIYQKQYEAGPSQAIRKTRWLGFGISGSLMVVTLALVCGITDLSLLLALVVLCSVAAMVGFAVEHRTPAVQPIEARFLGAIGCISGLAPLLGIGLYLVGTSVWGGGYSPAYLYGAFIAAAGMFCGLAAGLYLRLRGQGKWAEYAHDERASMLVLLASQTVFVWVIFAGALQP